MCKFRLALSSIRMSDVNTQLCSPPCYSANTEITTYSLATVEAAGNSIIKYALPTWLLCIEWNKEQHFFWIQVFSQIIHDSL
jgi:hypothetical protein